MLAPIPGFARADTAEQRHDVVRCYLRLLGPATPRLVAGYLDAPVRAVRARWPADAVQVVVDGETRWVLADDIDRLAGALPPRVTRLLGPFDPFLQARDRSLLVADTPRAKDLWRALGRPGAVLVDGELAGTWRPRKSGATLALEVDLWAPVGAAVRRRVGEQAERLADHRGVRLAALDLSS